METKSPDQYLLESKKDTIASPSSYWSLEIDTDGKSTLYQFSPLIELIVGFKPDYFTAGLKQWLGVVHPEDRQKVFDFLSNLMSREHEGVIEYRVIRPDGLVRWVSDCATSLRLPDGSMRLDGSINDITERKQAEEMLRRSNQQLAVWINELQQRKNKIELLDNITKALQPCGRLEEVYEVLSRYAAEIFPNQPGALYLFDVTSNCLQRVVAWGNFKADITFEADGCYAWQSGKAHISPGSNNKLLCKHDQNYLRDDVLYLCAPLIAQGERVGVLYLHRPVNDFEEKEAYDSVEFWKSMAMMVTERLGFIVLNLKLRQDLLNQSVRDGLTSLHSRSYFEEALQGEIRRSKRYKRSIGVILMDIDHLDQIIDTLGQPAGNVVLQAIGKLIYSQIRGSDVACRYGVSEFAVLLSEASLEDTGRRGALINAEVKNLQVTFGDHTFKSLTLCMGVAAYPQHGQTLEDLLGTAELALKDARLKGCSQIITAKVNQE